MAVLKCDKYIARQLYVAFVAAMTYFFLGVAFVFSTEVIVQIERNRNIDIEQASWIGSSGVLFSFAGCLINGFLMDAFGRKSVLYATYLLNFIGWGILAVTSYLFVGRLIISFSMGIGFSSLVFITEICVPKYRGTLSSFSCVLETFGMLLINWMNYSISWHACSFIFCLLSLLLLLNVFFVPETPYWYMLKKQQGSAEKSLLWIRKKSDIDVELQEITQHIQQNQNNKDQLVKVWLKWETWQTFLKYSCYVVLIELNGYDMLLPYSTQFFVKLNHTSLDDQVLTILLCAVCFIGGIASVYLVGLANRRRLLEISNLLMGLLFAIAAVMEMFSSTECAVCSWITVISMLCTGFLTEMAIFTLPWIVMSEVLTTEIRGTVFSWLAAEFFVIIFVIDMIFPYYIATVPISLILLQFGLFAFLSAAFVHYLVPETFGIILATN